MRYLFIIIVLTAPSTLWAGWKSETVASEGDVGYGCSLAVDRWKRPHISYVDKTQGKVVYARYTGSYWEFEDVAEDVDVYGATALTLDPFDNPYVLFCDMKAGELTYAYRSGSNWRTERVASGSDYGNYLSINVWPTDPHISCDRAYFTNPRLYYGYRDEGGWHTEIVAYGSGYFNTVYVDDGGNPNIVYWHDTSDSVKHAVRKNGEWVIDDIAEGADCDAIVGPDNKYHVSFATADHASIIYAVSTTGGSWKFENVKAALGTPGFTQICVNAAGDVFISYFSFAKSNLRVVTKKGGSWTREAVAPGAYISPHSTALGSDGYPLIAYYHSNKRDLMLARHYFTDVELTSFTATRSRAGVDIRWTVGRAEGVAGYNLYRESTGAGLDKINDVFIEGRSPFVYVDGRAPATECRYWLEAVATTGKGQTFGPATVPPAAQPGTFALYANVPNPVAGATTFSFELPEGADLTLAVYDAAGRKVAAVAEGYFSAGRHDVPFRNDLAPGVYVYRLDAGSRSAARKMVVVK
jgi:hypothetical protein